MIVNSNGKIDRKALIKLKLSNLKEEYITPKNNIEEKVS
jgi:hypothetical protein